MRNTDDRDQEMQIDILATDREERRRIAGWKDLRTRFQLITEKSRDPEV